MRNYLPFICFFLSLQGALYAQVVINETENNDSQNSTGIKTVTDPVRVTGQICNSCTPNDPNDFWKIGNGAEGTFTAAWTTGNTVVLAAFDNQDRTGTPLLTTLSSGMAVTLSAEKYYSFRCSDPRDNTGGVPINYSVELSGSIFVPRAYNVAVIGSYREGETLTGSYSWSNLDGDTESGSTYKWYRSDDFSGTNQTAITSATGTTYVLTDNDLGKYIAFEVTPSDGTETGPAKKSNWAGPVNVPIVIDGNNRLYVDKDVSGGDQNGNSWTNAIPELHEVLNWVRSHDFGTNSLPEIWVAAGTYMPAVSDKGIATEGRTATFYIHKDGIKLYGGFAGTETSLGSRDIAANPTILSGNLGAANDKTDNSYHVIFLDGTTAQGTITNATLIDGFTVRDGNADRDENNDDVGGGAYLRGNGSGNTCSPIFTNITFTNNNSLHRGGAMYNYAGGGGTSSPVITKCDFLNNSSAYGAAIANYVSSNGSSSAFITSCSFSGNSADNGGGAMYNRGTEGASNNPVVTNCSFSGNSSAGRGGAIYNIGSGGTVKLTVTNSTFSGNKASSAGAIFNRARNDNRSVSSSSIRNSIILGNNSGVVNGGPGSTNSSISYSLVQDHTITPGDGNISTTGIVATDVFASPKHFDNAPTTEGNYTLKQVSGNPVIDKGSNTFYQNGQTPDLSDVTTDLAGNKRFRDSKVDMGAYELNFPPNATNVIVTGTYEADSTLTGSYNWSDANSGDAESSSTYQWYHADDASATNLSKIDGATGKTYILTNNDVGKHIAFEVSPSDGTNHGTAVKSSWALVPVPAPSIPDLSAGSDKGSSDTDNLTNDNTPTFIGKALSGATIRLKSSVNGELGTTAVDSDGKWTFTATSAMDEGVHNISVITIVNETESAPSDLLEITIDTIAPSVVVSGPDAPVSEPFKATITFSEAVYDFVLEDITVSNASLSNLLSEDSITYTATVTPVANGNITISTDAGVAQDQAGNNNTASNSFTVEAYLNDDADASIATLTINGEKHTNPQQSINYVIDCSNMTDQVEVSFVTNAQATSNTGAEFVMDVPRPGIYRKTITTTSVDGSESIDYNIVVEKKFQSEQIIEQKFNNVLLVNNNFNNNGGYTFVKYQWFKNGKLIGTKQYYSAGDAVENTLDPNASYQVVVTTESGDVLSVCEFAIELDLQSNILYPNPVTPGSVINIKTGFKPAELEGTKIEIYSLTGILLQQLQATENKTTITIADNLSPGIYLVVYKTAKYKKTFKLVVK